MDDNVNAFLSRIEDIRTANLGEMLDHYSNGLSVPEATRIVTQVASSTDVNVLFRDEVILYGTAYVLTQYGLAANALWDVIASHG